VGIYKPSRAVRLRAPFGGGLGFQAHFSCFLPRFLQKARYSLLLTPHRATCSWRKATGLISVPISHDLSSLISHDLSSFSFDFKESPMARYISPWADASHGEESSGNLR